MGDQTRYPWVGSQVFYQFVKSPRYLNYNVLVQLHRDTLLYQVNDVPRKES